VSDWLLYVLTGALLIVVLAGFYSYAKNKGIGEYATIKWVNIFFAAVFVFGNAVKKFWHFRNRCTFWVELSVLVFCSFCITFAASLGAGRLFLAHGCHRRSSVGDGSFSAKTGV
jgi:hypothetical protein